MLLQVTHGSAFCSSKQVTSEWASGLTIVKEIHADISRARLRERGTGTTTSSRNQTCRNFYVGTNDPRVILCLTPG